MSCFCKCSKVSSVSLTSLKSLVKSIQGLEEKKDMAFLYKRGSAQDEPMDDEFQRDEREVANKVLTLYIKEISTSLHSFCGNHLPELKKTLITRTSHHQKRQGVVHKATVHEIKNQTIKDLIFVMSEIACHLPLGDSINHSKC